MNKMDMLEERPKISVVMAVYKAESYLDRCMKTLLGQTFRDFEVIMVDDGSPDNSGKMCDGYAATDTRVRVIHQENQGVGAARQKGIDNARGEYIIHVDPDDWIELNMLELLYNRAVETGTDMVICNIVAEKEGKSAPFTLNDQRIYREQFKYENYPEYVRLFGTGLVNKLIKTEIYNVVRIPSLLKACEDTYVILYLLSRGVSLSSITESLYHYDMATNNNSLTGYKKPNKKQLEYQMPYIKHLEEENGITGLLKDREITKFAHFVFNYNLMSQYEYTRFFFRYIPRILNSTLAFRKKFNCIVSALGFKWLIRRPYLLIKKLVLNDVELSNKYIE